MLKPLVKITVSVHNQLLRGILWTLCLMTDSQHSIIYLILSVYSSLLMLIVTSY
jgi:hypothetical protein